MAGYSLNGRCARRIPPQTATPSEMMASRVGNRMDAGSDRGRRLQNNMGCRELLQRCSNRTCNNRSGLTLQIVFRLFPPGIMDLLYARVLRRRLGFAPKFFVEKRQS